MAKGSQARIDRGGRTLATVADHPARWLGATRLVDKDAPGIQLILPEIVGNAATDRECAVRIHDFVRDEIEFGWTARFHDVKASQMLRARRGYCNTKATLFIALLRAAGIPARQRFVDLRSEVLYGLVRTDTAYVDHSFTEVFVDRRWIGVDSYIVDHPLYLGAEGKLSRSGRMLGWGTHRHGSLEWDGLTPSFIQYVNDGSVLELSTRDHGVFADTADFYASVKNAWNRRSRLHRLVLRFVFPVANIRVARLRAHRR